MSILSDLIESVLLNDLGAEGYTAAELVKRGYGEMNHVTAALSALLQKGIVCREKDEDAYRKPYRYWHAANVTPVYGYDDEPEQAAPAPLPDVLITLALGNREAVTCTLSDARALHLQLSALFGA